MKENNPMRKIRVEKVVVNMGVGAEKEEMKKAQEILKRATDRKPVQTLCKVKQPTWGIREGLPIGLKVTLRKEKAVEFLKDAFKARDNELRERSFDSQGNFGFGIKEYIDLPKIKYDPKLGIKGLDVLVRLQRKGFRVSKRKNKKKKIPLNHRVSREEAIEFVKEGFGVDVHGRKER